MTEHPEPSPGRSRRLGHDVAGEAYPAGHPSRSGEAPHLTPAEPVASRTTEDEARDIVAIRRAKRGDTAAFAALLDANDTAVRALVWALIGPDLLDEVCTRVYLRAFRGLPLAPGSSPRMWLLGIADGTARDLIRRWERHPETRVDEPPVPLDLPAEQRLVLAAVDAVGLTLTETARLVDGGVDATRERLEAARGHEATTLPLGPVPDHHPGFWDSLGRRLLIEQSQPAATTTRPVEVDPTASDSAPGGTDAARGMAFRIEQQNPRSFPWRRTGLAAAVLLTIAVLVGAAVSIAHRASTRDAGLGDTAAKSLDELDAALAGDTVVRGTARISAADLDGLIPEGNVEFVRTNTGSWRNRAEDRSFEEGYDVASSRFVTIRTDSRDRVQATVHTGIAPGPPAATATADDVLGDLMADAIRVVRSGANGSVVSRTTPTTTGPDGLVPPERRLWEVTSTLEADRATVPLAGSGLLERVPADEAVLTADRSLALPTRLELRRGGVTVLTVQFSDLAISQQPPSTKFAPDPPEGAQVTRTDDGFEAMPLGALTSREETTPTPAYLPAGYILTAAAVDPETHTVVVCYRNGSRQLVLTGRPSSGDDPETGKAPETTVAVTSGSFAGNDAQVREGDVSQVRVHDADTEVVLVGDPPVDELVKVVASLR